MKKSHIVMLPIFLLVMYVMFLLAINIGGALQPIFDAGSVAVFVHGIQWVGYTLHFPEWLTIFLAQGIGGGITKSVVQTKSAADPRPCRRPLGRRHPTRGFA